MLDKETIEFVILGRAVGTVSACDHNDSYNMFVYDYVPAPNSKIPASDCLSFNFIEGTVKAYDDEGEVIFSLDIIQALSGIEKGS